MRSDPAHIEAVRVAIFGHPDPTPEWREPLPYLLEVPSLFAANAAFWRFNSRTLRPMLKTRPEDRFLQAVAVRLIEVLAYRSTLPPALWFWKPDRVPG